MHNDQQFLKHPPRSQHSFSPPCSPRNSLRSTPTPHHLRTPIACTSSQQDHTPAGPRPTSPPKRSPRPNDPLRPPPKPQTWIYDDHRLPPPEPQTRIYDPRPSPKRDLRRSQIAPAQAPNVDLRQLPNELRFSSRMPAPLPACWFFCFCRSRLRFLEIILPFLLRRWGLAAATQHNQHHNDEDHHPTRNQENCE